MAPQCGTLDARQPKGIVMLEHAMRYAALGWKIVVIHGITDDGRCTCGALHTGSESSRGKHPMLRNWGKEATSDEDRLCELWDQNPLANVGLLLGPESGVIDVEFDGEEGRATAERLLAGIVTPTYESGRSVHRLFKWSRELPNVQKVLAGGLEVRIGGGDRQTQSVLPPSKHHSGANYRWLEGLSPDECDVADVPAELLALIFNQDAPLFGGNGTGGGGYSGTGKARVVFSDDAVKEGERNATMLAFACRFAYRSPDINRPQEQSDLWDTIAAHNLRKFRPPLDEAELRDLHRKAIQYAMRATASGASARAEPPRYEDVMRPETNGRGTVTAESKDNAPPAERAGYTLHGLVYRNCEWFPGDWRLTVVHGDPVTYRLHVPAWQDLTDDGTGDVLLSVDEYSKPDKVARKVQARTKTVILDDRPRVWPAIWNGAITKDEEGNRIEARGLKAKLMDTKLDEYPPPIAKRYVELAEYLDEQLEAAIEETKPDPYGAPVLRPDGCIWFRWRAIWAQAMQQKQFSVADIADFSERLGLKKHDFKQHPSSGKGRKRYCIFAPKHVARLREMLADGGEEEE